ncbi:hypothetical protein [Synechococcus phage Ssp-JY37]
MIDGVTCFLFGVLVGVFLVITCWTIAFCLGAKDINQRGEQDDG